MGAKEENVATAQVNTEAAFSRILNADMAAEQVNATKFGILQQTALAMLAQVNTGPQAILSLFRQ
jgi:flagellin